MNNKVKNIDKIVSEFERIRDLGFLPNNRPNNKDGGIGNTFEDYLVPHDATKQKTIKAIYG